ncbi:MAG: hypothetical protein ACM3ZB_09370 [bacterium]|jgi:hypothetical protein
MRALTALLLAATIVAEAARPDKVEYVGGTLGLPRAEGVADLTGVKYFVFRSRQAELKIPYDRVNLLEYGQDVNRRLALAIIISPLLLLSKKRQHFLTVGYEDTAGRQQAAVFRVDKRSVRSVLAAMEARTGRKVEFQDIEARKAAGL